MVALSIEYEPLHAHPLGQSANSVQTLAQPPFSRHICPSRQRHCPFLTPHAFFLGFFFRSAAAAGNSSSAAPASTSSRAWRREPTTRANVSMRFAPIAAPPVRGRVHSTTPTVAERGAERMARRAPFLHLPHAASAGAHTPSSARDGVGCVFHAASAGSTESAVQRSGIGVPGRPAAHALDPSHVIANWGRDSAEVAGPGCGVCERSRAPTGQPVRPGWRLAVPVMAASVRSLG